MAPMLFVTAAHNNFAVDDEYIWDCVRVCGSFSNLFSISRDICVTSMIQFVFMHLTAFSRDEVWKRASALIKFKNKNEKDGNREHINAYEICCWFCKYYQSATKDHYRLEGRNCNGKPFHNSFPTKWTFRIQSKRKFISKI